MEESRPISAILQGRIEPLRFGVIAESTALQKACANVLARWPGYSANPQDAAAILHKVWRYIQDWRQGEAGELRMADVRRAALYAFAPAYEYPAVPGAAFDAIRAFLLRELEYNTDIAFLTAMATGYLHNYAPAEPYMQKFAAALARAIGHIYAGGTGGKIWKWQKFFERFPEALSNGDCAPRIADMLTREANPRAALAEECGLRLPDNANIMQYIYSAYIGKMRPLLEQIYPVRAVLAWLSPDGSREKAQKFDAHIAIEALLAPWVNNSNPPADVQNLLLEQLVKLYGDPRLDKGSPWAETAEQCKNVLIRWLTKQNMLFFLQVVSRVEDSHMWEPRRQFWLGLYDAGLIDSAWVGFSEQARKVAQSIKDVRVRRDFGLQTQRQFQRENTSLLVMQIGDAIIVEGSHSYKVQIFRRSDPKAPQLYEFSYDCEDIRRSHSDNDQIVHNPSVWRQKVLDRLWAYNKNNKIGDKIELSKRSLAGGY